MPIFFVHGVSVRDTDPGYAAGVATRNELLQRLVLQPLAAHGERFRNMALVSPYWGGNGVRFHWQLASLPKASTVEHLGAENAPQEADLIIAETIEAIANQPLSEATTGGVPVAAGSRRETAPHVEALGATATGAVTRAAQNDLVRLVETLLTPLMLAEIRLLEEEAGAPPEGQLEALLAIAAYEVATDPAVQAKVKRATSDEEVIEILHKAVDEHFAAKVTEELATAPVGSPVESLGPGWLDAVRGQIGTLFSRVLNAPLQALVANQREPLHRNLARFLGDIFVYLIARGEMGTPGPIVATVLNAIQNTPKQHPDEPVIIITHSMGGNILYDLVTHYAPDLQVDLWVSVGGQVGQFEEMKLFRQSDQGVSAPQKVNKPHVGYWLNVYDPADILSFQVAPIFNGVDADEAFLSGANPLKAHGEYFGRASFYELLRKHAEQALI